MLSLALMQTWLCVYSLLNVCVRRRKHCKNSKHPVRSFLGPGSAKSSAPNNTEAGPGARHCRWEPLQASRETG